MKLNFIKIFAAICFIGVVVVNYLANARPINNITTGAVSDSYPNLFAPAGITFSIWGVIYLLLALYILYQFSVFGDIKSKNDLLNKIGIYFIITSIANMLWIFAWHFDYIGVSVILMLVLLFGLIKITELLRVESEKKRLSIKDYFLMKVPFSVYFGWITIATIANITTFLVSINWGGLGLSNQMWTIIFLIIGAIIGVSVTLHQRDVAYVLVLIWAYTGILIKHASESGFNLEYSHIITTTLFCMTLFVLLVGFLLKKYFVISDSRI